MLKKRHPRPGKRNAVIALTGFLATALIMSVCSPTAYAKPAAQKVTLTFWENYGTQQTLLGAANNLIAAYKKVQPNVTIKMVSEPANDYFALLQASAISHTGPDLAVMWTGLYLPPYADILANVRPYISKSI